MSVLSKSDAGETRCNFFILRAVKNEIVAACRHCLVFSPSHLVIVSVP